MSNTHSRRALTGGSILSLFASCLTAQAPVATLPAGFLTTGGQAPGGRGTGTAFVFDSGRLRYQERHAGWLGSGTRTLSGVAFRRPWGQGPAAGAVARRLDLSFRLGLAQGTAMVAQSFAANYQQSSVRLAFAGQAVALPDRRQQPAVIPAPWDLRLPFQTPFVYGGQADLIWEVECSKPSVAAGTGYYCDRADGSGFLRTDSRRRSGGCGTQSLRARFYNYGLQGRTYKMRLYLDADQHPASAPVTVALGLQTLGIQPPSWCAAVHPDPLVYLPLGRTNAAGDLAGRYFNQPYVAAAEGLVLQLQSVAPDPGQVAGIGLSSGEDLLLPPSPGPAAQGFAFIYQSSPSTSIKGPYGSGAVITGWF